MQFTSGELVSASNENIIKIWDVDSGKCVSTLGGHTNLIISLYQLTNGYLVSGAKYGEIKVLEPLTGKCLCSMNLGQSLSNFVDSLQQINDNEIAAGYHDGNIRIWDINSGRCLRTMYTSGIVLSLTKLPDGILISGGAFDKDIKLWDVDSGKCIYNFTHKTENNNDLACLQMLNNGNIALGYRRNNIKIYDLNPIISQLELVSDGQTFRLR